jgi:hypothetical protein
MEHDDAQLAVAARCSHPCRIGTKWQRLNEGDSNPVPFLLFED